MSEHSLTSSPDVIKETVLRPASKSKEEWQQEEMVRTALNLMRKGSCDSFQIAYADDKIDVLVEVKLLSVKRIDKTQN